MNCECKICHESFKSFGSLSKHVKYTHKVSSEQYYLMFNDPGVCKICNKKTKFININVGYKEACCISCGAILHRQRLKADSEKFERFRSKVSNNVTQLHKNLTESEKADRILKATNSRNETVAQLTKEEKKQKFGWLNKLQEKEKEQAIEKMTKPLFDWWKYSSYEQKQTVVEKRTANYGRYKCKSREYVVSEEEQIKVNKKLCDVFEINYVP